MHQFDSETADMMMAILSQWLERLRIEASLDSSTTVEHLQQIAPSFINEEGNNAHTVLDCFKNNIAIYNVSTDSPRFLSFIPAAPTKASLLFDSLVSSASLNATSWLEGSGTIWAENQVLAFLAQMIGFPHEAGGCFVSGGSIANLSALAVARDQWRKKGIVDKPYIVVSQQSHSSVVNAAHILDCKIITIPENENYKLSMANVLTTIEKQEIPVENICALVATAGTTNIGIVDDLLSISQLCRKKNWWLHIDGAYGGAGILLPELSHLYKGIEHADSFIVDPHKWLFAPFDCAALLYRNPALAKETHCQKASYLDVLQNEESNWNPTDYAFHLTRRARGLPLWFSLSVHGVAAYRKAIRKAVVMAQQTAQKITHHKNCSLLLEPELSIVVFECKGWQQQDYQQWSDWLLQEQIGFVVPSSFMGKPVLRMAFLHPDTTSTMVDEILNTL